MKQQRDKNPYRKPKTRGQMVSYKNNKMLSFACVILTQNYKNLG